jgi:hypothetical protein
VEQRSVTAFLHRNQQSTDVPIADLQSAGSFPLGELLLPYLVQHT